MNFTEGNLYCPNILIPSARALRTSLNWGLSGRFTPFIPAYAGINCLKSNLRAYLMYLSDESIADELVREYIKSGEKLPDGRFILSEPLLQSSGKRQFMQDEITPQYRSLSRKDAKFYIDGDLGFGLGLQLPQSKHPAWLCIASFSMEGSLPAYYHNTISYFRREHQEYDSLEAILNNVRTKYKECDGPIIVQLQGVSKGINGIHGTYKNNGRYLEAADILNKIRWEHALIKLCSTWTEQAGFEKMHILPGEDIAWNRAHDKYLPGFKARYNGTAKKMGFKKDPNGFYTLQLAA